MPIFSTARSCVTLCNLINAKPCEPLISRRTKQPLGRFVSILSLLSADPATSTMRNEAQNYPAPMDVLGWVYLRRRLGCVFIADPP